MNFETMDWKLEARRVAAAFGVSAECYFEERFDDAQVPSGLGNNFLLCFLDGLDSYRLPEHEGVAFWCYYDKENGPCYFFERLEEQRLTGVRMYSDGSRGFITDVPELWPLLVKGLFLLGLLADEEDEFGGLCLTAHQKIEWVLEYEARYEL